MCVENLLRSVYQVEIVTPNGFLLMLCHHNTSVWLYVDGLGIINQHEVWFLIFLEVGHENTKTSKHCQMLHIFTLIDINTMETHAYHQNGIKPFTDATPRPNLTLTLTLTLMLTICRVALCKPPHTCFFLVSRPQTIATLGIYN